MSDPFPSPAAIERMIADVHVWFCNCDQREGPSADDIIAMLRALSSRCEAAEAERDEAVALLKQWLAAYDARRRQETVPS